jgi:hypothetical protein
MIDDASGEANAASLGTATETLLTSHARRKGVAVPSILMKNF